MPQLKPRLPVPRLSVERVNLGPWTLQDQQPESFTIIFFYRGYHCPQCRLQLRDVERHMEEFEELGAQVIAISTDEQERAEETVREWELERLPVGYGFSTGEARQWGLFVSKSIKEKEPSEFSEPGIFFVNPDGTLYASIVQTMPFSRPSTDQVIRALRTIVKDDYPARGEA